MVMANNRQKPQRQLQQPENAQLLVENTVVAEVSAEEIKVENQNTSEQVQNIETEQAQIEIVEPTINNESADKNQQTTCEKDDYTDNDFENLANLMNSSVRKIKEDLFLNQIYLLMSKVAKIVVRYNVSEVELEQLFKNSKTLKTDGIIVSPTYLSVCKRVKNKNKLTEVKISSIIDFPFGESTFKTKVSAIREGKSYGVQEPTVMMPSMLLSEQNIKQFKKQCSRLGWKKAGIALNATDIDEETLKRAVKASNKSKISHIVYVFGEEPIDVVMQKLQMICSNKGAKNIFVLANVDKAETVSEIIKLGVDKVLTPYADDIGKELLEKFKIKSIKMV